MEGIANGLLTEKGTDGSQYLTFLLGDQEYGVDILTVQEIRGWHKATSIPNAPAYMLGVINLRGIIVPIINLRKCFNMPEIEVTFSTVIVVIKIPHKNGERTVGLVVDAVSDVYVIADKEINKSPEVSSAISTDFIKGLASVNDKMVILLTIDELINVGVLDEAAAES